jgi:DNA polymerase III sliding clamp (beta) subunit (PCNA family)
MAPTQMTFNCQVMSCQDEHTQATLSLIGGTYPDFNPIVAMDTESHILRCPKGGLKQAVLLSDVIARGDTRNHFVKIASVDGSLHIGAAYSQWGENTAVCPVEIVAGESRAFGLNAKYMGEAVTHAPGEHVDIIIPEDMGGPIHVRAVDNDHWLAVIMPIALSRI